MAYILRVYIIDPGDQMIKVAHEFYGYTLAEAETYCDEHIGSCSYFAGAMKDDRVIEIVEEVDESELPTPASISEEFEED